MGATGVPFLKLFTGEYWQTWGNKIAEDWGKGDYIGAFGDVLGAGVDTVSGGLITSGTELLVDSADNGNQVCEGIVDYFEGVEDCTEYFQKEAAEKIEKGDIVGAAFSTVTNVANLATCGGLQKGVEALVDSDSVAANSYVDTMYKVQNAYDEGNYLGGVLVGTVSSVTSAVAGTAETIEDTLTGTTSQERAENAAKHVSFLQYKWNQFKTWKPAAYVVAGAKFFALEAADLLMDNQFESYSEKGITLDAFVDSEIEKAKEVITKYENNMNGVTEDGTASGKTDDPSNATTNASKPSGLSIAGAFASASSTAPATTSETTMPTTSSPATSTKPVDDVPAPSENAEPAADGPSL